MVEEKTTHDTSVNCTLEALVSRSIFFYSVICLENIKLFHNLPIKDENDINYIIFIDHFDTWYVCCELEKNMLTRNMELRK